MTRTVWTGLIVLTAGVVGHGQQAPVPIGERLLRDVRVVAALAAVEADEPRTTAEQIRLCEIPAPPFQEADRGRVYREAFEALGLLEVRVDAVGNVIGVRRGRGAGPRLVLAAHLDTVFPEGTDVRVTREGTVLRGPGIADDCRGLAVLLAVARGLDQARIETDGPITFVGTVGEEGLGDLRGVKHLLGTELRGQVDLFVAVDGTGYGITNEAVGSHRYRVRIQGPGGHSYGNFGIPNPIHALGRAIETISRFDVPSRPKTTFSVGRVGGGASVNAIAAEAWLEIDMRSSDAAALQALDTRFHRAVDAAVESENARWGVDALSVVMELVGDRPAGFTPRDAPIVETAVSVTRALGLPVSLGEGSTDANLAMSRRIPAIGVAAGGRGTGSHSLGETFETSEAWRGTQRLLLIAIALADEPDR